MLKIFLIAAALISFSSKALAQSPLVEYGFNERMASPATPADHVSYQGQLFEDGRLLITKSIVCKTCLFVKDPTEKFDILLSPNSMTELLNNNIASLETAKVATNENERMCRMMPPPFKYDLGLKVRGEDGSMRLVLGSNACYDRFITKPTDDYVNNQAKELRRVLRVLIFEYTK